MSSEDGQLPSTSSANQNDEAKAWLQEDFEYDCTECYACGGFYGPSFANPLCATCHSFLYPYNLWRSNTMLLPSSGDDNDSGNDEPSDPSPLVAGGARGSGSIVSSMAGGGSGDSERARTGRRCSDLGEPSSSGSHAPNNSGPPDVEMARTNALPLSSQSVRTPHVGPEMSSHRRSGLLPHGILSCSSVPSSCPPQRASQPIHGFERHSSMDSDDDSIEGDDELSPALAYRLNLLSVPQDYHLQPSKFQLFSVEALPPEILLVIFCGLDDLSLWCASQVCAQWRRLILGHISNEKWKEYTSQRFPLYVSAPKVQDWYSVYSSLVESSCCMQCLFDMKRKTIPAVRESTWRRRILHEVRNMSQEPAQGISACTLDADYCLWQASIAGPCGSPYEGGLFYLFLTVPYSYPMEPPQVRFLTRIFHPNISRHGDVGIDSITHNWSLALTINKILVSVQSLLTDPYCED